MSKMEAFTMANAKYTRMKDVIDTFVEKYSGMHEAAQVVNSWSDIVGEKLCAHCRLIDIKQESIIIEVDHPAIAQELQLLKQTILQKVRTYYPELAIQTIKTRAAKNYPSTAIPPNEPSQKPPHTKEQTVTRNDTQEPKKTVPQELKAILERIKVND